MLQNFILTFCIPFRKVSIIDNEHDHYYIITINQILI